ncbi:uncharacterized protein LOC134739975 [Pongo pygmaeus]|uniref:uncharacterized protein LOC134739975 n=1 Tax=Pongo pygmaeus TaxID=9600 RepID=UPI00300C2B66
MTTAAITGSPPHSPGLARGQGHGERRLQGPHGPAGQGCTAEYGARARTGLVPGARSRRRRPRPLTFRAGGGRRAPDGSARPRPTPPGRRALPGRSGPREDRTPPWPCGGGAGSEEEAFPRAAPPLVGCARAWLSRTRWPGSRPRLQSARARGAALRGAQKPAPRRLGASFPTPALHRPAPLASGQDPRTPPPLHTRFRWCPCPAVTANTVPDIAEWAPGAEVPLVESNCPDEGGASQGTEDRTKRTQKPASSREGRRRSERVGQAGNQRSGPRGPRTHAEQVTESATENKRMLIPDAQDTYQGLMVYQSNAQQLWLAGQLNFWTTESNWEMGHLPPTREAKTTAVTGGVSATVHGWRRLHMQCLGNLSVRTCQASSLTRKQAHGDIGANTENSR